MRRGTTAAAIVVMLLLVTAVPAGAKEFSGATLSGGAGSTIDVGGRDAMDLAAASDLLESRSSEDPPAKSSLGPRYVLTYSFRADKRYEWTQHVYPYAKGGAWVYVPPGQDFFDGELQSGWTSAGEPMTAALIDAGLPERTPRSSPVAGPRPAPAAPAPSPLPYAAGVVIVLAAALFVVRRMRRPAATP